MLQSCPIPRRPFLAAALALAMLSWRCGGQPDKTGANSNPEKPNIIFIMADDLGYNDLGCYGQKAIHTPVLDQMAREGMQFAECYAGSTVCAPSRSVLMTGQHTGHTTVRGNNGIGGVTGLGGAPGRIPLRAEDVTIAEILKSVGYTTGMIGKWGLGEPGTEGLPGKQGFDEFFGYLNQRRAHSYFPDYIWKNTDTLHLSGNENGGRAVYIHDLFTEATLDFIKRKKAGPFFLYLPYTLPHDKYEIPDLGQYADSTHWTLEEQTYAAMVTRLDTDIGRIFELLKAEGLDEKTVVFFCSDNGAAQLWPGRFDSSGKLRGRKRDMYEGGLRVPMIVRYPGKVAAGTTSNTPWYFADVLPTFADLAGAKVPDNVDGISILSDILSISGGGSYSDRAFYWEFYESGFQQAIRWRLWKGVRLSPDSSWELYNLEKDPEEQVNAADLFPDIVDSLTQIAQREHSPSPYFPVEK